MGAGRTKRDHGLCLREGSPRKLPVYKHLLEVNAGFDQVIRALAALRKHEAFHRREFDHYLPSLTSCMTACSETAGGRLCPRQAADDAP